ncbi:hypothetical protein GCK32_018283, partial [Trichostrongylus colubriformis]
WEKSKGVIVADLRADLARADAEVKEAVIRENALHADLKEAREEIKDLRQRIEKESRVKEEQEAHHREREDSRERNRLSFAAQLEENQVMLLKSAAQLEEVSRKKQALEGDIIKLEAALTRNEERKWTKDSGSQVHRIKLKTACNIASWNPRIQADAFPSTLTRTSFKLKLIYSRGL